MHDLGLHVRDYTKPLISNFELNLLFKICSILSILSLQNVLSDIIIFYDETKPVGYSKQLTGSFKQI